MPVLNRTLLVVLACIGISILFWNRLPIEGARTLGPDELIPDRIVVCRSPKLGGEEVVVIEDRFEAEELMRSLPVKYDRPFCGCFSVYEIKFYGQNELFRSIGYRPGDYLRDSQHPSSQATVPRRYSRMFESRIGDGR